MEKPLIYVVEDEEPLRELYSYALENDFNVVCVENYDRFLDALKLKIPNLIILDIMLKGVDGFEILEYLKSSNYQNIPVIMVSAKGEEISKVKGLNLGADDYISKPFGVLELIARIKANLRKNVNKTPNELIYKDIVINDEKRTITVNKEEITTTLKEYNLLKILILNSQKVITRDKLFNDVWGSDFLGETRTLDMHIKELRKKISESECNIETIRGVGYVIK